ncbi:MAG: MnhB domain-containing protein [Halobacteriota archaeon]
MSQAADPGQAYTESPIILTAVRVVSPFVLTYGLFVTFHGADKPGGGFQGGVIIGTVVLLLAFAFGIDPIRLWVGDRLSTALAAGGVVVFSAIGLATVALGGAFLEYERIPIQDASKWGIEAVEIGGIAAIISGVVIALFFLTAGGYDVEEAEE